MSDRTNFYIANQTEPDKLTGSLGDKTGVNNENLPKKTQLP